MTVFAGQPISASDINDWQPVTAVKPTLTARNTTVSNTADPDLTLALVANATYDVTARLFLSSAVNAAGDWRGTWTWTNTATVSHGGQGIVTAIASGGSGDVILSPTNRLDTTSPGSDFLAGCTTSGIFTIFYARVVTGGSPVQFTLAWSQRASNGNDTRVLEGSSLTAQRIA